MLCRCRSQRIVSIVVAYRVVLLDPFSERFQGFAELFLRADVLDGSFQCGLVVRWARCNLLWRQGLQLSLNAIEEVLIGACGSAQDRHCPQELNIPSICQMSVAGQH